MKFSKIASVAAAITAAGMMSVSANALWLPVKDADKAEKLHTAVGASWMLVPYFDGVAKADEGKPVGGIDELD